MNVETLAGTSTELTVQDGYLTAAKAKQLFSYNANTGEILWAEKTSKFSNSKIGMPAGCQDKGYLRIKIFDKSYASHRIAWLIHYGVWPSAGIDHIDGDHSNNAISNLRDVSQRINCENIRAPYSNNKSKFLGAYRHHKKWAAKVQVNGIGKYLGVFDSAELAHHAYLAAKRNLHEGNTL